MYMALALPSSAAIVSRRMSRTSRAGQAVDFLEVEAEFLFVDERCDT
jgi:hypothetical protein